ncbi:hypothetical protein C8Q80DRAFT_762266 [Daedaleopsis nitida]|nr:hypothetical protein C8Q80DRAFT_762266 [Daedaleopsis nitida]
MPHGHGALPSFTLLADTDCFSPYQPPVPWACGSVVVRWTYGSHPSGIGAYDTGARLSLAPASLPPPSPRLVSPSPTRGCCYKYWPRTMRIDEHDIVGLNEPVLHRVRTCSRHTTEWAKLWTCWPPSRSGDNLIKLPMVIPSPHRSSIVPVCSGSGDVSCSGSLRSFWGGERTPEKSERVRKYEKTRICGGTVLLDVPSGPQISGVTICPSRPSVSYSPSSSFLSITLFHRDLLSLASCHTRRPSPRWSWSAICVIAQLCYSWTTEGLAS